MPTETTFRIDFHIEQTGLDVQGEASISPNHPTLNADITQDGLSLSGGQYIYPSMDDFITFGKWFKGDKGDPGDKVQADWEQSDTQAPSYIKHKPTIPSNTSDLNNDSGFITANDVPAQQQADWGESDNTKPSFVKNKPSLGTSSALDVAQSGNASTHQVVKGDDTRLSDARNAADVYSWAKAATKPSYSASEVGAIPSTDKGANGGVAELDSSGKVPSSQLPSFVDDTVEGYLYNGLWYSDEQHIIPVSGESGKIYVELETNKTYRWSGSAFVEISESLALGETSSTAYAGNKGKANADAIAGIKNGATINSFGGVETALSDKISKSQTAGLVKNDGTIDTNTYLTQHQDITGKADKVSGATNGNFAALDSNGNLIDSGHKHSDYLTSQTNADWNASSGVSQILNKPTIPDAVSGVNDGTNWTSITIGDTTKSIPSGGGGLSDYDFTHTANTTVSTSTATVTFAANTRGSAMLTISADIGLTITCNNESDNYIWIKNTGSAEVDVTISAVTLSGTSVSNVYVPSDGITVPAGGVCEIGILVNSDGAFITTRNDLAL